MCIRDRPGAARAGSLRAVEGKELRAGCGQADFADRADGFRGVQRVAVGSLVGFVHDDPALAVAQGQLHRVGQTPPDAVLDDQTVNHEIDGVLLVLVQRGEIFHAVQPVSYTHLDVYKRQTPVWPRSASRSPSKKP